MTVLSWHIGDVVVHRVEELVSQAPRDMLLPGISDEQLAENRSWLQPYFTDDGLLNLSFHTFVVISQGITMVIDTCLGDDPVRVMPGDSTFPDRLGAAIPGGLDAVDVVLCTHLHFDHVGWNTRIVDGQRVPTFPNARYLFARLELDHLEVDDSHDVKHDDVQPLLDAGLVDVVETKHTLYSEVHTFPTPGHTPGHVSLMIESNGQRAVITGDATHSPIQFRYPHIAATPFDWDSEMSTATREQMIAQWADTDVLILGTHFAPPTAGYIKRNDDHVWFE